MPSPAFPWKLAFLWWGSLTLKQVPIREGGWRQPQSEDQMLRPLQVPDRCERGAGCRVTCCWGPVGRCLWGSPQGGAQGAGFSYLVLLRRGECPRAAGVQRLAGRRRQHSTWVYCCSGGRSFAWGSGWASGAPNWPLDMLPGPHVRATEVIKNFW